MPSCHTLNKGTGYDVRDHNCQVCQQVGTCKKNQVGASEKAPFNTTPGGQAKGVPGFSMTDVADQLDTLQQKIDNSKTPAG